MKHETGNWEVVRDCCTSGQCSECRGSAVRPKRIVSGDAYSEAYAQHIAKNWFRYNAVAREMQP